MHAAAPDVNPTGEAARRYIRRTDGSLHQVRKHPLDLFDISRPVNYQISA
jgi:hypothetical protein